MVKNCKMKYLKLAMVAVAVALFLCSCGKTCRCYRYDGNVDEYTLDELDEMNTNCTLMEDRDFGLVYSLCETVLF